MGWADKTIWEKLAECVATLHEPFSRSEIHDWFRRHYPETNERSLRTHIQYARSDAPNRGSFASRTPLITQIGYGLYQRYREPDTAVVPQPTPRREVDEQPPTMREEPTSAPAGVEDRERGFPEKRVQSLVVAYLAREGWRLEREADTDTRERGIDVVAERSGQTVGIEVKGYPGTRYADPRRWDEVKKTQPSMQTATWFASAILSAMRLRGKKPEMLSVIALPDVTRYRRLTAEVEASLSAAGIGVWLVDEDGVVEVLLSANKDGGVISRGS